MNSRCTMPGWRQRTPMWGRGTSRAIRPVLVPCTSLKVRETIRQHVQNGRIEEIDREQRASGVVYEIEYTTADGIEYEMDVAEDGRLLTKKQE